MKLPILWLASVAMFARANADCCHFTKIEYVIWPEKSCEQRVPGGFRTSWDGENKRSVCQANVCNNGLPLVGSYCGQSKCNWLGCDCDGGCLYDNNPDHPDDPLKNFVKHFGPMNQAGVEPKVLPRW